MFDKSSCFKQVGQLLLSLIVGLWKGTNLSMSGIRESTFSVHKWYIKGYGVGARAESTCVELFECPPGQKSHICKKFLHRHETQRIGTQPNLPLVKFSFPKALKTTTTTTTTNKQKHCHATLISLSLPAEATQFFSSGCQSIANAGPLCPTCWMKGELVWRLSHNYNKKDGKNASQVSRNLVPRGFSLFNMVSEEKLVTWFGCVTGSSLLLPL